MQQNIGCEKLQMCCTGQNRTCKLILQYKNSYNSNNKIKILK